MPLQPAWAPVVYSYSGVLEIAPQWVATHIDDVCILDVRTIIETEEDSAHIKGALLIPVNELLTRLGEVPTTKLVLTICRAGKRSVLSFQYFAGGGPRTSS